MSTMKRIIERLISRKYDVLSLMAHALFFVGLILLFFYSEESGKPIIVEQSKLYQVILVYAIGYSIVFVKWLGVIKCDEPYLGNADEVPQYLSNQLWGAFPYLWTLGKSNKRNQGQSGLIAHTYKDSDVRNKRFGEIFLIHVNRFGVVILVLLCMLLPLFFLSQTPATFLKFVNYYPILFTIYTSLFIIAWLSSLAILILRIILLAKYKLSK